MEEKTFKKLVSKILVELGFEKNRSFFYKKNKDTTFVLGIQKSKYSNGFYINVGYVLHGLHPNLKYPKDVDGDIRTRFSIIQNDRETDIIDLDELPKAKFDFIEFAIRKNCSELIEEVEKNGIAWLLDKEPTLLYQTTLKAKNYLNI